MSAMVTQEQRDKEYKEARAAQEIFRGAIQFTMEGKVDKLDALILEFLKSNQGVSAQDMITDFQSEGRTLLHIATSSGHSNVFDYLIQKLDSDHIVQMINQPDDKGFTPLINATIGENSHIMAKLLELGAQVNARNLDQASAIHFAAGDGSVERMKLLVDSGADISLHSLTGGNCLHWAAGKGRSEVIKYLISLGSSKVDINDAPPPCLPAIIMAAVSSCDSGVAALVDAGADTGLILSGNLTLLHICAENNLLEAAASILKTENGAKCCLVETSDGNKPVHLAAMVGHVKMMELLIPSSDAGSDVALLLKDGKKRMAHWEAKHKADSNSLNSSASVNGGSSNGDGATKNKNRSTRALEPVKAAANAEAEAQAEAAKDKGNELFKIKNFSEALVHYTKAIDLKGDDATYWSNRSACFLSLGDAPNSLLDAEVCRRIRPDWTKGCYRLAAARMALGYYEDAAVAAFEGLKLDNSNLPLKLLTQEAVKKGQEEYQKQLAASNKA